MGIIIELRSGDWLARDAAGAIRGTVSLSEARVFASMIEARAWAKHAGLSRYDLWMDDGETWIGDWSDDATHGLRGEKSRDVPALTRGPGDAGVPVDVCDGRTHGH